MKTLDEVAAALRKLSLSVPPDALVAHVRPAIALEAGAARKKLPVGSSKLGGCPDLPPGMAWPKKGGVHLAHLAQLDLADLAPHDAAGVLPREGHLYFFLAVQDCWDEDAEGFPGDTGRYTVLYSDAPRSELRAAEMPEDLVDYLEGMGDGEVFEQRPLKFAPCFTLPVGLDWDGQLMEDKGEELTRVLERLEKLSGVSYDHADLVLGHGQASDLAPDDFTPARLQLLQLSGHPLIGGETTASFFIDQRRLAKRDFRKVDLFMEN